MSDWGPWIEHDGKGCPVSIGYVVQARWLATNSGNRYQKGDTGLTRIVQVTDAVVQHLAWDWRNEGKVFGGKRCSGRFTAYRIRRPKALEELIRLAQEFPEGVKA